MSDLGSKLRQARLKADLTIQALANLVGLSGVTIFNYESGKRTPRVDDLEKIAAALGLTMCDFFSDPMQPPATEPEVSGAERKTA